LIDAEQHFWAQRQVIERSQSIFTDKEISAMKDRALFGVLKRNVGGIRRTTSCQMDSMGRTLKNAQAVLKEAGTVFAKMFAGLSKAQLKIEIEKTFKKFDSDGSGFLDRCVSVYVCVSCVLRVVCCVLCVSVACCVLCVCLCARKHTRPPARMESNSLCDN
jgi:hypothetical protein